jgi:hypothetical protein
MHRKYFPSSSAHGRGSPPPKDQVTLASHRWYVVSYHSFLRFPPSARPKPPPYFFVVVSNICSLDPCSCPTKHTYQGREGEKVTPLISPVRGHEKIEIEEGIGLTVRHLHREGKNPSRLGESFLIWFSFTNFWHVIFGLKLELLLVNKSSIVSTQKIELLPPLSQLLKRKRALWAGAYTEERARLSPQSAEQKATPGHSTLSAAGARRRRPPMPTRVSASSEGFCGVCSLR